MQIKRAFPKALRSGDLFFRPATNTPTLYQFRSDPDYTGELDEFGELRVPVFALDPPSEYNEDAIKDGIYEELGVSECWIICTKNELLYQVIP